MATGWSSYLQLFYDNHLGLVVQSWINVNPGLKFNPVFWFGYFCVSVLLKIPQKKTPIHPDKFSKEIASKLMNKQLKNLLRFVS